MSAQTPRKRMTTRDIAAMRRRGEPIAMLTAYDATMAALVDMAGVDMILVGDSLGNVVLGHETTLPVTLDDMIRHAAAVKRGSSRALLVCDMPFGSVTDPDAALASAVRVMKETGVEAVKLEGGLAMVPTVRRLVEHGIAVVGQEEGDLAERVVGDEFGRFRIRVGQHAFEGQARIGRGHAHFGRIGRGG